MIYLLLFIEFFKIGLFSIGGGLATLPFLYELAEKYDWITTADISTMIAISESTPGPMGVNMATYVGYNTTGVLGGVIATFGLVTPSIIIITLVASVLQKFKDSKMVQGMFKWIRPASTALIAAAFITIAKNTLFPTWALELDYLIKTAIAVTLFMLIMKFKKHPILYIIAAAIIGIALQL